MKENYLTSLQNPLVKHLVKLRQDREYRYAEQSIVIEGVKPLQEVSRHVKRLFCTESAADVLIQPKEKWIVSESIMKKISGMVHPEGVLAEVQMPPLSNLEGLNYIVAFDGVNDPGNMGTLLRTALALGWEGAFILPNSCDPFNEKALRSARGAHFRLPLAMGTIAQLKELVGCNHLEALVADLTGTSPEDISNQKGRLLVLGNEAHGASSEIYSFCSSVTLPMPGNMESLNVAIAGGILMYLLRHRSDI